MMDNSGLLVVFDLDDTLYKECDYVKSGQLYVAYALARQYGLPADTVVGAMMDNENSLTPFDRLHAFLGGRVPVGKMVEMYREHKPSLVLPDDSRYCLETLSKAGVVLAMITDGRHNGQWNKIHALGLERYFDSSLISVSADVGWDKTHSEPWNRMETLTAGCHTRWYIGDNPRKDFYHPRRLGWHTVMLADNGLNVMQQDIPLPEDYKAEVTIVSLNELPSIILDHKVVRTSLCNYMGNKASNNVTS